MRNWAMLIGLAMVPASAEAAEPLRPPLSFLRDLRLSIQARRALRNDSVLAKHNLGVEVRDGLAVAWGPVPDAATARRVVAVLDQIAGIDEVKTEFHVSRLEPEREAPYRAAKVELPAPPVEKPKPVPKAAPVAGGIEARIAAMRKTNPRFASIRVETEGKSITVQRGSDPDGASLFAQKLQEIEGIEEVLLGSAD